MFEPEVFRKQMYCIEEITCDIIGTFRRLGNGNCATLAPPRYAPAPNQPKRFENENESNDCMEALSCKSHENEP